jgi:hypothetical protein
VLLCFLAAAAEALQSACLQRTVWQLQQRSVLQWPLLLVVGLMVQVSAA